MTPSESKIPGDVWSLAPAIRATARWTLHWTIEFRGECTDCERRLWLQVVPRPRLPEDGKVLPKANSATLRRAA